MYLLEVYIVRNLLFYGLVLVLLYEMGKILLCSVFTEFYSVYSSWFMFKLLFQCSSFSYFY